MKVVTIVMLLLVGTASGAETYNQKRDRQLAEIRAKQEKARKEPIKINTIDLGRRSKPAVKLKGFFYRDQNGVMRYYDPPR